jgi:hypothetical protein
VPVKKPRGEKRIKRVPVFFTPAEHRDMKRVLKASSNDGLSDYLREAGFEKARRDGLLPPV